MTSKTMSKLAAVIDEQSEKGDTWAAIARVADEQGTTFAEAFDYVVTTGLHRLAALARFSAKRAAKKSAPTGKNRHRARA